MLLLRANLLFFAFTLLTQAYGSALAPVILPRATVCNGHEELCSRSYGNVSYVGAHDSYAFKVGARKSCSTNHFLSFLIAERWAVIQLHPIKIKMVHLANERLVLRFSTTTSSDTAVE